MPLFEDLMESATSSVQRLHATVRLLLQSARSLRVVQWSEKTPPFLETLKTEFVRAFDAVGPQSETYAPFGLQLPGKLFGRLFEHLHAIVPRFLAYFASSFGISSIQFFLDDELKRNWVGNLPSELFTSRQLLVVISRATNRALLCAMPDASFRENLNLYISFFANPKDRDSEACFRIANRCRLLGISLTSSETR
jgi:hypothetical protein